MYKFSFIDFGLKDFLRDEYDEVLIIKLNSFYEAEEWLLSNGEEYDWTNQGVKYLCWDIEEGEVNIDDVPAH